MYDLCFSAGPHTRLCAPPPPSNFMANAFFLFSFLVTSAHALEEFAAQDVELDDVIDDDLDFERKANATFACSDDT